MHTIYHDLSIAVSPEQVFNAVAEPKHLINWWPLKCTGSPARGKPYNFYFGPEYNWYGDVAVSEPHKHFHIKMTKSDPDWDPTTFGFDLEPIKSGVRLHFFHKDWPEANAHFKTASFCWAMLLNGLKMYLEKGIILPFEERS